MSVFKRLSATIPAQMQDNHQFVTLHQGNTTPPKTFHTIYITQVLSKMIISSVYKGKELHAKTH